MAPKKDEALWVMGSKVNTSVMAWRIRTMGSASFVFDVCWFQLGICTLKEDRVGNILKGRLARRTSMGPRRACLG